MARRPSLIKTKKKSTRAAPTVRRGKKLSGPDFTGWDNWTGEKFYKFKNDAKYFYYENYQETDLLPEVWAWMKENGYTNQDIRNATKATGWNGISVWTAIICKLLRTGCPDFNQAEAGYWKDLRGTSGEVAPLSNFVKLRIEHAINAGKLDVAMNSTDAAPKIATRQNIQEVMRERASDAFSEIEALADDFINSSCPKEFATRDKVHATLNEQKVLPHHIGQYVKHWENIKFEYEAAKIGKDPEIKEGYAKYTRTQINNMIKFAGQIIDDLGDYVAIKQATRAPRPKKTVPVEKIVSKLKYLKHFKDDTVKLDLTSVSPVKLHNATEAYLYDTAKRKLIYLIADEYSKCFTVKGTTILGFDTKKSQSKTLRKPHEQLKEFMKIGKPAGRKFFDEIKTVATIPNGRTNESIIILKVW